MNAATNAPCRTILALAMGFALALTACARTSAVEHDRVTVSDTFTVAVEEPWSRITETDPFGRDPPEIWTRNGLLLDAIYFFTDVEPGEPLFDPPGRRDETLPIFRADMTPPEIAELIETSLARMAGTSLVEASNLRPEPLGDNPGFRFDLHFVGDDEVARRGFAVGAVVDDLLHVVLFWGTELHHYNLQRADVERLIGSLRFISTGN